MVLCFDNYFCRLPIAEAERNMIENPTDNRFSQAGAENDPRSFPQKLRFSETSEVHRPLPGKLCTQPSLFNVCPCSTKECECRSPITCHRSSFRNYQRTTSSTLGVESMKMDRCLI